MKPALLIFFIFFFSLSFSQKRSDIKRYNDSLLLELQRSSDKFLEDLKKPKPIDEKYGFKELKFEMSDSIFLTIVETIQMDSALPGTRQYKILNPSYLKIGDCELSNLISIFFNGKLMKIMADIKGISNSQCVLEASKTAFGSPYQPNQYIEKYYWFGTKTTLIYNVNSLTHDSYFIMDAKKLTDEYKIYEDNRNAKNAAGF